MKKKNNVSISSTDWFRVISTFFVFAIFLNAIYIPCYFYIRQINEKTILDHKQSVLDVGMFTLESSIDALLAMPDTVSVSSDLNTTYYDRADFNDLNLNRLRKLFNASLLPFDFITEMGLTLDDSVLFTRSRIYYDKDFLSYAEYFSCNREGYLSEFTGSHCVLPTARFSTDAGASDYDAITIAFRWQRTSSMYFFVHCPVNQLLSLFADEELQSCSYIAVYTHDTLIAEKGTPLTGNYKTLTTEMDNQLGISVVLQIPDSYIVQNLTSMTHLVRVFISVVLLTAILWVFVFSLILWQPFRNIQRMLHRSGHVPNGASGALLDDIMSLNQQVSYYKEISETQREHNRIHLFEKTLYRGIHGEGALSSFLNAFPDFPNRWQLAMLQYVSDDSDIPAEALQPTLVQSLQTLFPNVFLLPHDQDSFLLLLSAVSGNNHEILQNFCTQIEQKHRISITFACSKIYEDVTALQDAFQEVEYEEFLPASKSHLAAISIQQLQTIYYALQCGDANAAIAVLKKVSANTLAQNDIFSAKHSYRMLGYVLVSLKMEFTCIADIPIPTFYVGNIRQFYEAELPLCFRTIAEKIRQQNAEQTEKLDQSVLLYIQENLSDPQLCVTMVAEHFQISASTLQKRMNSACGKTFSAYVESLRMQRAQQLLRETSDTVQEIAEAVGYINANSFYKAYKRCFGEPPLSYRNRT